MKKKYLILVMLAVFFSGIFFRAFHFGDWLIFQSDQSRDALIILNATRDISQLPLIGPQARGSELHLGPVFYYFQYISAKVFGASPVTIALPDLILGILVIPLLFLLLKNFVSVQVAAAVTLIASASLFLVTFSRFAWNPNSLAFFSTTLALLITYIVNKKPHRISMIIGASFCIGVIFQLHFIAALSLALTLLAFLILFRPLNWKEFILSTLVIIFVQTPLIIYEFKTDGVMTNAFFSTVQEKGTKDSKTFYEKFFRMYQSHSEIFWLNATGRNDINVISTKGTKIKCDTDCIETLPEKVASLVFLALLLVIAFRFWKYKIGQKTALSFFGLWLTFYSLVTTLVAYQISTRFYLSITPIIFILLAILFEWLLSLNTSKAWRMSIFGLILISFLLNAYSTGIYFRGLAVAGESNGDSKKDLVFGTEEKVTLSQLRRIASASAASFSGNGPIIVSGESRYARSLYYLLSNENNHSGCYIKGTVRDPLPNNHVILKKNKDQDDFTKFGTLATKTLSGDGTSLIPADCITY